MSFTFDPAGSPRGRPDTFAAACTILRGVLGRHYPPYPPPLSCRSHLLTKGMTARPALRGPALLISFFKTHVATLWKCSCFFRVWRGGGRRQGGIEQSPPSPCKGKILPICRW